MADIEKKSKLPVGIRVAYISGKFGLVVAFIVLTPWIYKTFLFKPDALVEIVDLKINIDDVAGPNIDVKLRNIGERIAFLHSARFEIHKKYLYMMLFSLTKVA